MTTHGRKTVQGAMFWLLRGVTILVVAILVWLLGFLIWNGAGALSWEFLFGMPREGMTAGGIFPALIGTLILTFLSIAIAFPIGLLSGIYLAHYSPDNWTKRFIDLMTNNLAGVPSIVFGLFGMALFVIGFGIGDSILAGSLTLALLVLPVIIRTTDEALRAVPQDLYLASIGLGATKWTSIRKVVLPVAFPRILTGLILSVGRVAGETAPILFTVAAYYLPRIPTSVFDQVMALPYHLYVISTSGTDIEKTRPLAYGTALVLLVLILILNGAAALLRRRFAAQTRLA